MTNLETIGGPQHIERHASGTEGLTPLQEHFLARLQQLVSQREEFLRSNPADKAGLKLLSRALYATYMDCVGAGVGDQGNAIMERSQAGAS
jgi:hypothetical protein